MVIPLKEPITCFTDKQHISCLETLTPEEKAIVDANKVDVEYKKGETIVKQGAFASHIILLHEGLAKIYIEGKPKDLILKIVPSNFIIGLPAVYEGNNTFPYTVSTYTHSHVSLIDINLFKQLLNSNPKFAVKVINILNEDTALIYGRFFCLTMKQAHGRVADILLCLANRVFKSLSFDLPISRNDLADLTGLSSESVIRILKEFSDQGIIQKDGKKFVLLDPDRLQKISKIG